MIYGKPSIKITKDTTDRNGLRTLVLSQLWQPQGNAPLSIEDQDAQEPDVPAVPGGVLFIGRQRAPEKGGFRTYWTFEGIGGNGKDVTFKDRAHSIDYWFEGSLSERSLLELPNIQDILNQFNGVAQDGQIIWQPTLPGGASNGAMVGAPSGAVNPLFGYQSSFVNDGTYHFRYLSNGYGSIPFSNAGKVMETGKLPGTPPTTESVNANERTGRNWLAMPPAPRRVGPVYEVLESFWLSREGGWPTQIYPKA
jgi:hypothetical protein